MTIVKKSLFGITLVLLVLFLFGCSNGTTPETSDHTEKEFLFTVVDLKGNETEFHITTTKATVGEALEEEGLISGEEGPYGTYIKTVNGVTLDYDKDGKYWAFYVNDEYATSGADKTEIVSGNTYSFKAE
ncbi:MAG: DUF4430 domain-containing protein [Ruminococcaceae bacterium]|nr:DUF4430 domain-containing protein [Oscillospiraceae bacterium]